MRIIGINWSHPSGACLLENNMIAAAVCEERFSRLKNDKAFPLESIRYCKSSGNISNEITGVGVTNLTTAYKAQLWQYNLSVEDMIHEQHAVWYPRLYEGKTVDEALVFKHRWNCKQYPEEYWSEYNPEKEETFSFDRLKIIGDVVGISPDRIIPIEHHWCHAYYGYYGSPYRNENKALVITIDGSGDYGLNATVSIVESGEMHRIYETSKCVLGRIYSHVTLLLGMKRLEHEYKVMGLAPYGKEKYARPAYDIFNDVLDIKGIEIDWKNRPKDCYFYFRDKLEGIRFDNIAAGLQMWVEDVLCKWISNIVNETGIHTVIVSGGVSMNIKAMGKVAALKCIDRFFVCGSSSDDSCPVGAAIGAAIHYGQSKTSIQMDTMYLGPNVEPDDSKTVLAKAENIPNLIVERNPNNKRIAELLVSGYVIGRCKGRMEFGQRALGNRSLLADPSIADVVPRINAMIKNRDFWMPFAPVILDKYVERYLINPKNIQSPHMTIGYETTEEGWKSMKAACHSADKSARAQILTKNANPDLYDLLECFSKITGRGALMNTSFNLHGYPIVNTATEAYEVFMNSELDGLLLDGGLILRPHMKQSK